MTQYHEPVEDLSPQDRDVVRALHSLKEEIEAVDWYHQRAAATSDEALKAVLIHNRDEEIEHACMALEYLRRTLPAFDENLKTFLFTTAPITEIEEEEGAPEGGSKPRSEGSPAGSLGIGSLRR